MRGEPEKRAREGEIREVTVFFDIPKFRGWHSTSLHVLGGISSDSTLLSVAVDVAIGYFHWPVCYDSQRNTAWQ